MTTGSETTTVAFDQLSRQQLEIYARELQQHFREERRLQQQLRERNQQLEQRVRELNALNAMFQGHLEHCDSDVKAELGKSRPADLEAGRLGVSERA